MGAGLHPPWVYLLKWHLSSSLNTLLRKDVSSCAGKRAVSTSSSQDLSGD